ncbi:alpha-1B adrenergic receptor-like [Diadema antillarum]|uniref:alpha-1B adrenergic receptor-like n=1 Tax=Diadema antillarum TaxID=105358 RepID=UPI003A8403A9
MSRDMFVNVTSILTTIAINIVGDDDFSPPGPPRPPKSDVALALFIAYIILIIVSNFLMLVAFAVEKKLRTYTNYFIINLVIADLCVGLLLIASIVNVYHPESWLCKLHLALNDAILSVSVVGVVIICVDRHRATFDPIGHYTSRRKSRAVFANVLAWLVSCTFWLPYTLGWDLAARASADSDDSLDKACVPRYGMRAVSALVPAAVTIVLPLVIISVLYIRLMWKIRQTTSKRQVIHQGGDASVQVVTSFSNSMGSTIITTDGKSTGNFKESTLKQGESDPERERERGRERDREPAAASGKATRTLSFIIFSFLVAWIPHLIFLVVTTLDPSILRERKLPAALLFPISLMRYTNSFLNPASYAAAQPLVRTTVAKLFGCGGPRSK